MKQSNFLNKFYNEYSKTGKLQKYYYFMWRNKLNNTKTDFSTLTEDDFISKYLQGNDNKMKSLKMWESTEEYQQQMQELYSYKMNQDFIALYEIYLEKAKQGDEKAVNALKTIKKEIESLNRSKAPKKNEGGGENFDLD